MSGIAIRKYEYQEGRAKNYFASPTFIDGIDLENILIEGFPIFNEEYQNQFDSFEYLASDYDLVFSRLDTTLTSGGDTLEEFLGNDLDNHCLACKVTIGDRVFGGLIDVNSIKFIDDLTNDGYKIQLTIFSITKEFSQATEGKQYQPSFTLHRINDFLSEKSVSNCMFYLIDGTVLPSYVSINTDELDWVTRIGYEPVLIHELWASIVNSGVADDASCWKLFEDLCTAFGLIYKFDIGGLTDGYFNIILSIAFRDTGFSGNSITVDWINRERGFIRDLNANVLQCFKFQKKTDLTLATEQVPPSETAFYGTLFDKQRITTADGFVYFVGGGSGEEIFYSNGDGMTLVKLGDPFPFSFTDKVNFVELNYYFHTRYANGATLGYTYYVLSDSGTALGSPKYISFPRMFTKAGYIVDPDPTPIPSVPLRRAIHHPDGIYELWYDLIEGTCGEVYRYLLSTFKKYVSGDISLMNGFDVNLFDEITVNNETYKILKLSNLDLTNRQVQLYAIQD